MNQISNQTIREFRDQLRAEYAERKAADRIAAEVALGEMLADDQLLVRKATKFRCTKEEFAASLTGYMTSNPALLLQFRAAWMPA